LALRLYFVGAARPKRGLSVIGMSNMESLTDLFGGNVLYILIALVVVYFLFTNFL
jgi:hypothetical protein